MCRLYAVCHAIARGWFWPFLALIVATAAFGLYGLSVSPPDEHLTTRLFNVVLLYAMNAEWPQDDVTHWSLELARWCGFLVWFATILAVVVKLFHAGVLRQFVRLFARRHVVVVGLGSRGDRLVLALRALGHDVVVIEADESHPGVERCRASGAVVLAENPGDPASLHSAQVLRASHLLLLFANDRQNVEVALAAFRLLSESRRLSAGGATHCVVQVNEPGLNEVLRSHAALRPLDGRVDLRVLNRHELAARCMIREALVGRHSEPVRKLLILGLGRHGRLATSLIQRLAKDWVIERGRRCDDKLEVHLYDRDAVRWCQHLGERFPYLRKFVDLRGHDCWAESCGVGGCVELGVYDTAVDAAFILIPDEEQAVIQMRRLRACLPGTSTIVVRVDELHAGFGLLLEEESRVASTSAALRIVGLQDRLLDARMVLDPELETLAQTVHQDYLALLQNQASAALAAGRHDEADRLYDKPAYCRWEELKPHYRDSNRETAGRLVSYLHVPRQDGGERVFDLVFAPDEPIDPRDSYRLTTDSADSELERLSEREHDHWVDFYVKRGWTYSPVRNEAARQHPNIVPWDQLDEATREYDRNVVRRMPYVYAKADYRVVERLPVENR